jgi:hypothetical protein
LENVPNTWLMNKKPNKAIISHFLAPQAKKILSASSRTKRSTRGIEDVPSSTASTVDEDDYVGEEVAVAPPPPRTRTSRQTAHTSQDPDATLLAPTPAKARRGTSKHARTLDAEVDERPA